MDSLIKNYISALFVFISTILFFTPILGHQFGYINDYTIFEYDNRQCCLGFPETMQLFAIGRPLQAILLNIQLLFVSDVASLQTMRIFFVLLIGAAATLFSFYVQSNFNMARYSAAFLALLIFTLPSMVINSFWVAQSIPGIVPLFLVLLAHFWMQKRNSSDHNKTFVIVGVFSLIFSSLLIYPPATFFFLTLTFIKFVFGPKDIVRAKLADISAEVMILLAACIVYFLSIKYVLKPILLMSNFGGMDFKSYFHNLEAANSAYNFSLSFDFIGKITRIHDLFIMVVSAWFSRLPLSLIAPVAITCTAIFIWASIRSPYLKHLKIFAKIIFGLALSIAIPLLTAIPVLIGQGNYPILYRVIFASMAIVPIAIVFAIDRACMAKKSWLVYLPVAIVSAGFLLAAWDWSYKRLELIISRASAEYLHVQEAVSSQPCAKTREIRIPPIGSPPDPLGLLNQDFGYTAVNSIFVGMANAVARTTGQNIEGCRIVFDPLGPRYRADIAEGITFGREGYPNFVSSYKGISGREPWGRWTDGEEAAIEFTQSLPKRFTLRINAGASAYVVGKSIKVVVGENQKEFQVEKEPASDIVIPFITEGEEKIVSIRFPKIMSPAEQGRGGDTRHLGLALVKLTIDSQSTGQ